jgi:Arc/MetJ-type ribon-helix-helix transcriptional regulator
MHVHLKTSELEKFNNDQVTAGYFASAEAAVEAAIAQMKIDQRAIVLTESDLEAIEESEQQIDRGESVEFDTFAKEMREKYCGK